MKKVFRNIKTRLQIAYYVLFTPNSYFCIGISEQALIRLIKNDQYDFHVDVKRVAMHMHVFYMLLERIIASNFEDKALAKASFEAEVELYKQKAK